jgi:hypothetical protein
VSIVLIERQGSIKSPVLWLKDDRGEGEDVELFAKEQKTRALESWRSDGAQPEHLTIAANAEIKTSRSQKFTADSKTSICKYVDFLKIIPYMSCCHVLYLDNSQHRRDGLATALGGGPRHGRALRLGRIALAKNVQPAGDERQGPEKNAAFFL